MGAPSFFGDESDQYFCDSVLDHFAGSDDESYLFLPYSADSSDSVIVMGAPSFSGDESDQDFCDSVLARFAGSGDESDQLLCAIVVAMYHEREERKLSSPYAYFDVACSFLDHMTLVEPNPPCHIIDAVLTVFSLLAPSLPVAVLKGQTEFLAEMVLHLLRSPSLSPSKISVVPDNSVDHWVHCLDFAVSVFPGLKAEPINELYEAIKLALQDADGIIQMETYNALSDILKRPDSFDHWKCEEMSKLIADTFNSCHVSAKSHRLDCISFFIVRASKTKPNDEVNSFFWGTVGCSFIEIMLALNEDDIEIRSQSCDILLELGYELGGEKRGRGEEKFNGIVDMVGEGMVLDTPFARSALMKGMVCVADNLFSQLDDGHLIKANLRLVEVIIDKLQEETLQIRLQSLVECLLLWQSNSYYHFKEKVELLLEMLVTKCGFKAVEAVMPKEHMELLTNIRKRILGAKSEETASDHFSEATSSPAGKEEFA